MSRETSKSPRGSFDLMQRPYVGYLRADVTTDSGAWYAIGYVRRREGVVGVYEEADYVRLTFIHNEREHERIYTRSLTKTGIVTAAGRLVRDVLRLPRATR